MKRIYSFGDNALQESKTITAKIKLIDGKRVWSVYKVEYTNTNG